MKIMDEKIYAERNMQTRDDYAFILYFYANGISLSYTLQFSSTHLSMPLRIDLPALNEVPRPQPL